MTGTQLGPLAVGGKKGFQRVGLQTGQVRGDVSTVAPKKKPSERPCQSLQHRFARRHFREECTGLRREPTAPEPTGRFREKGQEGVHQAVPIHAPVKFQALLGTEAMGGSGAIEVFLAFAAFLASVAFVTSVTSWPSKKLEQGFGWLLEAYRGKKVMLVVCKVHDASLTLRPKACASDR
jgi:hypothetical protein